MCLSAETDNKKLSNSTWYQYQCKFRSGTMGLKLQTSGQNFLMYNIKNVEQFSQRSADLVQVSCYTAFFTITVT